VLDDGVSHAGRGAGLDRPFVVLMLMFGCRVRPAFDEWTMAACNLAIGATLMLVAAPHSR